MAYAIIERLKQNKEWQLLDQLAANVETKRKANHKKHEVWELSFDWKHCLRIAFANQKMLYMHQNPCRGKWELSKSPVDYVHSSAKFYSTGEQGVYAVKNIMEMQDIELARKSDI